jgi:hypothetical protein
MIRFSQWASPAQFNILHGLNVLGQKGIVTVLGEFFSPPGTLPPLPLPLQYSDFALKQKLRNAFSKVFLAQTLENTFRSFCSSAKSEYWRGRGKRKICFGWSA